MRRLSRRRLARRGYRACADDGRNEYRDDDGRGTKMIAWFDIKLHLIVNVKHEMVLAYEITDTKAEQLTIFVRAE